MKICSRQLKQYCLKGIISILFFISGWAFADDTTLDEVELKSVLLFKLINFIEWPIHEFNQLASFSICVLGQDDIGNVLGELEGRTSKGLPITIKRFEQSQSVIGNCQIAFISSSKESSLSLILNNLKTQPVLTVGDIPDFAQRGGMMQFTLKDGRIGFNINLSEVNDTELKIAAPLLQVSNIIEPIERKQ